MTTLPDDRDYYLSRARASHAMAARAADAGIASIHAELAARYEAMVADLGGGAAVVEQMRQAA